MRNKVVLIIIVVLTSFFAFAHSSTAAVPGFKLGNENLMEKEYHDLIKGKRVGLITNQSGVTSKGESLIDILARDPSINLTALYGPEHGIDGKANAGAYVESYIHEKLKIPVYSLYGKNRMPNEEMLAKVDVLLFDIQDIGARTYTYISTLNYSMVAAQKYNKSIIVLDRPNPLGGLIVDGPVLEEPYKTFVGVDILPMAHGMTVGELAKYFNRNIGAPLSVVPMEGYSREMIYQDTGIQWTATSPNIPNLQSVFGYMATGLGEGSGVFQADKFKWIGGRGIDAHKYANLLNQANLPGVRFVPEYRGGAGGVRLSIIDYHTFNPARTGIYALATAYSLHDFTVPKSSTSLPVPMFEKVMGSNKIGLYLEQGLSPQEIVNRYTPALNAFKREREKYLIYGSAKDSQVPPRGEINVTIDGKALVFDTNPYIDGNNRVMVPLRAVGEGLGARVDWNEKSREIKISGYTGTLLLKIDSTGALLNGVEKVMDTTPVIVNSRTMIPLRYVSEFLGALVNWHSDTRSVTIEKQ